MVDDPRVTEIRQRVEKAQRYRSGWITVAEADREWLLDQLASVSEALANRQKEHELLRASVPSDGAERQDPRGNRTDEAPSTGADIVRVMIDRCIDRSCEGGDSDSAQAASSEQCRDYYGANRVDEWCDMCLFNEAIKRLSVHDMKGSAQWTLDNIYTIARRRVNALNKNRQDVDALVASERAAWGHVLRLCEKVGCQSRGVLRDNGGSL